MSEAESPFSNESPLGGRLDAVDTTDPARLGETIDEARVAQLAWSALDLRERVRRLRGLKKNLLSRAEAIAELVHRECGKPVVEALLGEVLPSADLVDYWCASIEELLADTTIELDALTFPGKSGRTIRAPRGVIALITPWNYPIAIPLRTIVPALLAGNSVVLKPSEITPRSGAVIASLFDGLLPPNVLRIVQGGADVGEALVDGGVDLVVFTGSVATGKKIAVACAQKLVPTSLELSGKDAAIVLDDAPIERAANGIVWAAFTNAGQNCASVEVAYVHEKIAKAFIERVVALVGALDPKRDLGVMTTMRQMQIVKGQVERAVADGAEILAGGVPVADESRAFPPTVLRITDEATPLLEDETFGPVLPIVIVQSAAEAIEKVNHSRFALTTSLWTRDLDRARPMALALRSGVVTVNNHGFTAALPEAPWTGVADTGFGVTNGPHALSALTRPRFILEDASRSKSELWWYPYTPSLRSLALAMAKVRGGAGIVGRIQAFFSLLIALPKRLLGK